MRRASEFGIAALILLFGLVAQGAESPGNTVPDEAKIKALIEQLGDDSFQVREDARRALVDMGLAASDELSESLDNPDPEIAAQTGYLLLALQRGLISEDAYPTAKPILANFYQRPAAERLRRMRELAYLDDEVSLAIWSRLARYSVDEREAKTSALQMMQLPFAWDDPRGEARQALVRELVPPSKRAAATWLREHAETISDPQKRAEKFAEFAAQEEKLLDDSPDKTLPNIVQRLLRLQIEARDKAVSSQETTAPLVGKIVELEVGDSTTLYPLLRWLLDRKDYKAMAQLKSRLENEIDGNPIALCFYAEAERQQGNQQAAEQIAEKASQTPGVVSFTESTLAEQLFNWGLDSWGEYIYQRSLKEQDILAQSVALLYNSRRYSEFLHDRDRNAEAVQLRLSVADRIKALKKSSPEQLDRWQSELQFSMPEFLGRTYYFQACDCEQRKDRAGQLKAMHSALVEWPGDEDSLIMLYHLPDPGKAEQDLLKKLLPAAIEKKKAELSRSEHAEGFNQLAWLVGNTKGDMDEAIKFGQAAVAARIMSLLQRDEDEAPEIGGIYDTLAHCYAGKGDFARAARTQSIAHRLDPYSYQIKRKLDYFTSQAQKAH